MLSPSDYRAGVGIVLVNSHGLVFAGKRRDNRDHPWQMPQGGVMDDETPRQAVFREAREELGTHNISVLEFRPDWLYYDYPAPEASRRATLYRGQRHLWYLLSFEGHDADIRIDGAEGEFSEWRWSTPAQIIDEAVSFKQAAYRQVMRYFAPSLMSLSAGRPTGVTRIATSRHPRQITA